MLLEEFDDQRFANELVLFRGGPLRQRFADIVPTTVIGKRHKADARFFVRLVRVLRARRPDLVHSWGQTPNLWAPAAVVLARVPHLVATDRALDPWKGWFRSGADALLGRLADAVVGNAQAVVEAAAARGVPRAKLRVIPNAVRIPSAIGAPGEKALILLPARLDPVKGHDLVVEALPEIVRSVPESRVVFAGPAVRDVEVVFARRLRERLAELGLTDRVEFMGGVTETSKLLAKASVMVLASRSEGSPNSLLEAMAAGTPIVATAVGGVPEVFEDQRTGLLVPPDDVPALAHAITLALTHSEAARERARRARADMESRYSPAALVASWASLYEDVISARSGRS